jgi:hypothetical protein
MSKKEKENSYIHLTGFFFFFFGGGREVWGYKDPLHLVSNGEEQCKYKITIIPLLLKQPAPLHLVSNGEDPCPVSRGGGGGGGSSFHNKSI